MIKVSVLNAISIFFINLEIAYVKIMRMKMYVTVLLVNAANARMDFLEEASVQKVCILMSIINIKLLKYYNRTINEVMEGIPKGTLMGAY